MQETMKYIAIIGIFAAVTAVVVSERCHRDDTSNCYLTSCGNETLVCVHDTCSCEKASIAGMECSDRVDCGEGGRCQKSDNKDPHHQEPHHPDPHHHEEHMDGEWHCLDKACTCMNV